MSTFLCVDHSSGGKGLPLGACPAVPSGEGNSSPDLTPVLEKIASHLQEGNERARHLRLAVEALANMVQQKDAVVVVQPAALTVAPPVIQVQPSPVMVEGATVHVAPPLSPTVEVQVSAPQVTFQPPAVLPPEEPAQEVPWGLIEFFLAVLIVLLLGHGILTAYQAFRPGAQHAVSADP